nr:zinc finger, CCHC-type [Tanacetum cinerariifolium]
MTTSSANNSVFMGFFKNQKLRGPNFIDWYQQLRIVLSIEDKLNYLEQPISHALVASDGRLEVGKSVRSYVLKMKSYIDNLEGLGHPVTLGLGGSRKLKPGALSLYVGNGQHAAVEAIRSYHLSLPSGLVIVLNKFHYDPSITRGIISVSYLYDDGYVNRFVMTTSSANNSVFMGFFKNQKLRGPNFIDWYQQLRIVLSIEDKLNYLEQPISPALVASEGRLVASKILAAHTAWIKGSKEIAGLMLITMKPEIE